MKTRAYFFKNFPPVWTACLFYFLILGSYFFDLMMQNMMQTMEFQSEVFILGEVRQGIICIGAFGFGIWRFAAFYPYPAGKYGKWLALTPWRYGLQMPKGAVQLNITDIVVIAMLCLTTLLDRKIPVVTPMAIFLYTYIVMAMVSTISGIPLNKHWGKRFLILVIIPFAFYPQPSMNNMLISLAVCYFLCYSLLSNVLKAFPWNQRAWLDDDEDIFAQKSLKYIETGWPYSALAATEKKRFCIKNRTFTIIMFNLLIVWYLHSILALEAEYCRIGLSVLLCYFAILNIVIRLIVYLNGTTPPISFLGRIMNGYFIIPKYDRIFIAPLSIILLVALTVYFMPKPAQHAVWVFEGAVFTILCISMGFPPSLSQWRNIGAIRIVRSKFQENKTKQVQVQGQGTGLNKPIGELFTGK